MAHPVEHDLGDRAAAFERLEPGLVIDRLGQAQQRAPLVELAIAADGERPRGIAADRWRTAARR